MYQFKVVEGPEGSFEAHIYPTGQPENVIDVIAWCASAGEAAREGSKLVIGLRSEVREFADPGGRSALRAATPSNPRNLPCPTCAAPNRLTAADRKLGYQCDACADQAEAGGY